MLSLPRRVAHDGRDDRHLPHAAGEGGDHRRLTDGSAVTSPQRCSCCAGACCGAGGGGAGRDRVRRLPARGHPGAVRRHGDLDQRQCAHAHGQRRRRSWSSAELVAADRYSHTFDAVGTVPYCRPRVHARAGGRGTAADRPANRAGGRRPRVPPARAHRAGPQTPRPSRPTPCSAGRSGARRWRWMGTFTAAVRPTDSGSYRAVAGPDASPPSRSRAPPMQHPLVDLRRGRASRSRPTWRPPRAGRDGRAADAAARALRLVARADRAQRLARALRRHAAQGGFRARRPHPPRRRDDAGHQPSHAHRRNGTPEIRG